MFRFWGENMENSKKWLRFILIFASYLLVAVLASGAAFYLSDREPATLQPAQTQPEEAVKLEELAELIENYFVGESDRTAMADGAAVGMIDSLGDRWSYYIPASEYEAHMEQMENAYTGIGITVSNLEENFMEVLKVEPGSGAHEAGILPGDVVLEVEGQNVAEIGMDAMRQLIRGKEDTQIAVTVIRGEERIEFSVTRKLIQLEVASGKMLEGNIGYITINNFDDRCADETIAAIESLREQGAKALLFDVRFNPGGYKHELVKLLDYLLPEGPLFRSRSTGGEESVEMSDPSCLEMPMAVLVNADSYSAAEFFAAALWEYEWATVVGEPTVGKGYFQNTFELSDGSAVSLSVGKYFTPDGVSLAEVGGFIPDITEKVDEDTAALIYSDLLEPADDPQIQAAVKALQEKIEN